MWFEVGINVHVLPYGHPIDPAPFIEKTTLSSQLLCQLFLFDINNVATCSGIQKGKKIFRKILPAHCFHPAS